jgi:hypothetical protein
MSLPESFADRELLQQYLADQLLRGRLALVLGAGVSQPFGLPGWQTLVDRLFAETSITPPAGQRPERQADYLRAQFYKRNSAGFLDAVHRALYADTTIDRWTLHGTRSLAALGTIVMACARHGVANVITFNFDDLVELYLEQHGFVAISITKPEHWAENAHIRVYHPHGMLPRRTGVARSETLVLDQLSFAQVLQDEKNPWRQELRGVLRTHTCLFVGLSGDDLHLDALITATAGEHAVLPEQIPFWGVRLTTSDDVAKTLWAERKVATWTVSDYDVSLPDFLMDVCEHAARRAMHLSR